VFATTVASSKRDTARPRGLEATLHRLRHQLQTNRGLHANAAAALERFRKATRRAVLRAHDLLDTRHREYLPGYGRMGFMLMLKSLIDPSYFRAEEQHMRGMAFAFAKQFVEGGAEPAPASRKAQRDFYNAVDSLFLHLEGADLAPIFVMVRRSPCGDAPTAVTLERFLTESPNEELRLVFKRRTCVVIATHELSPGVNISQLGHTALSALRDVKATDGFLLATADQAAMTTDIVDLERFHVGNATTPFFANVMGLETGQSFVQWVPAGLRFTLAYPTPVQTGKSLAAILEGPGFRTLCDELGEKAVVDALRLDARERGSPVARVLEELGSGGTGQPGTIRQRAINGVYDDGHPWSGNLATSRRRCATASSRRTPARARSSTSSAPLSDARRHRRRSPGMGYTS
jgi:hypothetical protein